MRRKRWPVRNADELARHVARQFPELKRRQVMTIVNASLLAIRDSLLDQAREGEDRPHVTILNFGVFELRQYKETRKPHLKGGMHVVPARWRAGFRASHRWASKVAGLPTRTRAQELAGETLSLEPLPCPTPSNEEAPRDVSDLPSRGQP
jgi:nucleoid DNA-binding protein